MYRIDDIKEAFLHLVGLKQSYNTCDLVISDSLISTLSGLYFQDFHPLVTVDNLRAVAPDFKAMTYPSWNTAATYRIGDKVSYEMKGYRAKLANVGKNPLTSTNEWEYFDPFSEWLEDKIKGSIAKGVTSLINGRLSDKTAKLILENKTLFDGAGRLSDTILGTGSICGLEIIPVRAKGISLKIEKIGLQFSGTGSFNLYLFNSSDPLAIETIPITITRTGVVQWDTQTDLFLPYVDGASWYLVYDQDEIVEAGLTAINKNKDWTAPPCSTCNNQEYLSYMAWSRYIEVHPFKVNGDISQLWDIADNTYTYDCNYGLNLQFSLICDITDFIIEQKNIFASYIGLQFTTDMLREFLYNPNFRINRATENISPLQLSVELDGDPQSYRKGGLMYELLNAQKAINLSLDGMSKVCLPCHNGGIKWKV